MAATTRFGLLTLILSLPLWVGGAWLVRDARAAPPPAALPSRTLTATVVEVMATPCGPRRPGTCFRTVAAYTDAGRTRQVVSRSRYRPARHERGEPLSVVIDATGAAWIDIEWQEHHATRRREFENRRRSRSSWAGFSSAAAPSRCSWVSA